MDEKIEILDIVLPLDTKKYKLADKTASVCLLPRGSINLANAAVMLYKTSCYNSEDVRAVVHDVLRHRIGITYEAEAENITSVDIINKIINEVEVP
jgi:MoxR-like ATPase